MKVNREELVKALTTVKPGVASTDIVAQASAFVFSEGRVYSYDDEIAISAPCPLDSDFEGAIYANELLGLLSRMKSETVSLDFEKGDEIRIRGGRSHAGLKLLKQIEIPLDQLGDQKSWKLLPENFVKAVGFCSGFTGTDVTKPAVTCLNIRRSSIEATNNQHLVEYILKTPIRDNMMIPSSSIKKLISIKPTDYCSPPAEKENGRRSWVHFKNQGDVRFSCRLGAGEFPGLAAIKEKPLSPINFPMEIADIIERSTAIDSEDHSIVITIEDNQMTIEKKGRWGWFKETARVRYKGARISFLTSNLSFKDIFDPKAVVSISEKNDMLKIAHEDFEYYSALQLAPVPNEESYQEPF